MALEVNERDMKVEANKLLIQHFNAAGGQSAPHKGWFGKMALIVLLLHQRASATVAAMGDNGRRGGVMMALEAV